VSGLRAALSRLEARDWAWVAALLVVLALGVVQGLGWAQTGGLRFFLNSIVLTVLIGAIFAVGLTVVVGYTGLLDLGYVAFVAVGAYVVAIGLMITRQTPTEYPALPLSDLVLSDEQRRLEPREGEAVVVAERSNYKFDVVEGAAAVLAAQRRGERTIAARHQDGLALGVGTRAAHGAPLLRFPGAFLLLLGLGGLAGATMALVRGWPTLRLTGDYYAIVTLGFAEIVYLVLKNEVWLTGGPSGIKPPAAFKPQLLGTDLYNDTGRFYFLVVLVLALSVLAVRHLHRSRVGRTWAAIRADETAARSSGIDVDRAKMQAFAVSGFIGGVAGGLYTVKLENVVTPDTFKMDLSIVAVCSVVLGGIGSLRGAVLGAVVLWGLSEVLRFVTVIPQDARFLIYGLILVLLMRFRPQGLLPPRTGGRAPDAAAQAALRAADAPLFHLRGARG
jgi:branched-chain amino acid transport system permease protein